MHRHRLTRAPRPGRVGSRVHLHRRAALVVLRLPIVLCALVLCAACGGDSVTPTPDGSAARVRIVSAAAVTDTISATIPEALTVEVTDPSGSPMAGRGVHFEVAFIPRVPAGSGEYQPVGLSGPGAIAYEYQADITTDANGRAAVQVHFGTLATEADVHITVPTLGAGYVNDAHYTVRAGAPDHVVLTPGDSAVYVGAGYRLSGVLADRGGNKLATGPLSFTVVSGGATVAADGTVTATSVGRVRIDALASGKPGTAWLSVPPHAVVASQEHEPQSENAIGVYLMELDGSGRSAIASPIASARVSGVGFSWSPDGLDLVIARGDSIDLVSPGSAERRLVKMNGPVLLGARFSRDGAWIYFATATSGLARVRRDGSGLQQIGALGGGGWRPSPSPDGLSVAYGSSNTPCGVQDCIRVMDVATGQDRVYAGGRDWLVRGRNSAWSPVEDLIAYAWDTDVNNAEVGVIRADGTGQRILAKDLYGVNWMDFSPDGKWLLVGARFAPLQLFEVQTGARLPLTTLPNFKASAWRP